MEQAYAKVLCELIKNGKKPTDAVRALKELLEIRGRIALLPKIARAFARLAAREEARGKLTLTVARRGDAKHAIKEVEKFLTTQKISDTDLCEEVDETLIGGWRLEGQGVLVDASWKKSLLSIYTASTQ
ncbi:MAG TPA: F0F1 ATP synthase subunit delta [Candidatus Paceibacterota bacterium]